MSLARKILLSKILIITLLFSLIAPYIGSIANADYLTVGDKSNPTLTIHKYKEEQDQEGTGEPGDGSAEQENAIKDREPLSGVKFRITLTHKYNETTGQWEEQTGASPIEKVTDSNGVAAFTTADGLVLGRYQVEEIDGPADVILNPNKYSVDIPMTSENNGNQTLNYNVHIYPKNTVIRGDVELIKKDEDGNTLQGVQFGLFKADGTPVTDANNNPIVLTTDANGKISYTNLAAGEYYFQEQSVGVNQVAINTTRIPFEVKKAENGQGIEVTWKDTNINTGNVVVNYTIPEIEKDVMGTDFYAIDRDLEYTYNIKVKTPADIEKYRALGVKDVLDDRLTYVDGSWEVKGIDASNLTFSKDGQTLIWEVNDLSKLEGIKEFTISFKSKIKKDAELKDGEIGIPNDATLHFNNGKGTYTEPANPNNPGPYEPYEPNDPDKPTNPPKPMDPPRTPPVHVVASEGGFTIVKKDKSNDSLLAGAEFKLTTDEAGKNVVDATGTVIKVNGNKFNGTLEGLVTGQDGKIKIEGLTPGTYYLHETKAPTYVENGKTKAYRLLPKPVKITIKAGDEGTNEVTVYNSKSVWNLPQTGGIGTIIFTAVGLVIMAIALVALMRRKQQTA